MQLPRDLHLIGTPEHFLRPSSLEKLVNCQVQYTMGIGEDDEGGAAAQTGSLVHAAIAAFHQTEDESKRTAAAIEALGLNSPKFPLADLNEARLFLTPYLTDPRNKKAKFARDVNGKIAIEYPITLTLDPHPLDPTKQPITIQGTLDQIRVYSSERVSDYKSGTPSGWAMIHNHAPQVAAYMLGARASGFPGVTTGEIIRGRGYRTKDAKMPSPEGVFWSVPITVDGAYALLDRARLVVATMRAGYVDYGTGPHCSYCPLGGLDRCQEKANAKLFGAPAPGVKSLDVIPVDAMATVGMMEIPEMRDPALDKAIRKATNELAEKQAAKLPASLRAFVFPARIASV